MDQVPHTKEDLQRAFDVLRHPSWPTTLAETMTDPVRGRLVTLYADHLARSRTTVCTRAADPIARFLPSRRPIAAPASSPPFVTDRKRAAAGDRDE